MKKKFFLNANIIDPYNAIDEIGGLIVSESSGVKKIYSGDIYFGS